MHKPTAPLMRRFSMALAALALGLLSGCAGMRLVDSDVLSVAAVPPGMRLQGAKYRFERLPSQAHNPEVGLAEQQAEAAMTAVGLVRDDAHAQISVWVSLSSTQYAVDPWGRPLPLGWTPYGEVFMGRGTGPRSGLGLGMGMGMRFPPITHYQREAGLIMRDLSTGQVVYETRATHTGPWHDSATIFNTLFQAALANFPDPPAGLRRVNIELPR